MQKLVLAPLVLVGACVVGEDAPPPVESFAKQTMFSRVVLARLYQKADWTLPQAGATAAERVRYVCDRIAPLRPTYVSGTIRLDDDAPLTADQKAVFAGLRACVPDAKLDIVLNAEHYTDSARHASGLEARAALEHRADEIKALGADVVFFDFFNVAYNDSKSHEGWYEDALTRGTDYIRSLGLKVGGNVWGLDLPPNSDFVALDNFDRETTDGFAYDKQQIAAFRGKPIMLHVENNPQKLGSKGLMFIDGSADYRRDVVNKFAAAQGHDGFSYMFPVFFPLQCCSGATCGPDQCAAAGSTRIAYDASLDGPMLDKIKAGLAK